MKALIDGDAIVYASGFASDQRFYRVGDSDFKYKKDALDYCEGTGTDPSSIVLEVVPEPLEFCLHSTKEMLKKIVDRVKADQYQVFLSGRHNFRNDISTFAKYKGNRDPSHKPYYYDAIRSYLIAHWAAEVVDNIESDDAMGIAQCEEYYKPSWDNEDRTVICSIDKDMDMIPGLHYNWNKDSLYHVREDEAIKTFYIQLLVGDTADNIFGLYKVGPKTAEKLLKDCVNETDMWNVVKSEYFKRGLNPNVMEDSNDGSGEGCTEGVDGGSSKASKNRSRSNSKEDSTDGRSDQCASTEAISKWLYENTQLLWILRSPEGWWVPPDSYQEDVPF